MPFYNAVETIAETIDSILLQTLDSFELLAVDDGSADNSAAIVAAKAASDTRIKLLQPGRIGVSEAANYGAHHARSEIVARMDADDRMHPERLQRQYAALCDNPDFSLIGCQVAVFPEELIEAGFREYIRWQNGCLSDEDIADEIYVELPIANPSIMFRRDSIASIGGYRHGPFPEDYDLLMRLNRAGHKMMKLDEILLFWREGEDRLTRTDGRYSREAFDRLRAEYLSQDPRLQGDRPLVIWGAGRKSRKRASLLLELGHRIEAWIDIDSNKIGNIVQGVPVVSPQCLAREERPFVLGYVTNHGARDLIGADLQSMGYLRGRDYLMVG